MIDTRNVGDEFKGVPHDKIIEQLNARGVSLEIAIENTLRDFNMGTIVRSANAFGVRKVHVIGRRQWNKRGAMMTDKYLEIEYHETLDQFAMYVTSHDRVLYACENNVESQSIYDTIFAPNAVLLFGQEGAGLSDELLRITSYTVAIDQRGSTRSMNVGVAAGICMFEWSRQQRIQ